MIIDGHCHIGGWTEPSFSARCSAFSDAVEVYKSSGIDGVLAMPTDRAENKELLEVIQDHNDAEVAFRLCAWIDPRKPDNLPWFQSNKQHIAAAKIHPSFIKLPATNEAYTPYLDLASEAGWPVLIHCGRWQEMSSYRFGIDVAIRHPNLNVVLCHMGGDSTDLIESTVDVLCASDAPQNVYLGTESIRQYWVIERAIERLGADRVMFGSDYNLNHPRSFLAVVEALELDGEQRESVFGGNINRLLPEAHRFF